MMNRQYVGQVLFLIMAGALAVLSAYMVGNAHIWMIIFIIATGAALVLVYFFFRSPPEAIPRLPIIPQHLKPLFAERVALASNRLTQAKEGLRRSQSALTNAQNELVAATNATHQDPSAISSLQEKIRQAQQDLDEAQDNVRFEEADLDRLLNPGGVQSVLDRFDWGTVLQYAIFASLALYVLINLMAGITSSPPAGTTPRSMITLLVSVVVVGIALILVLSTIVSEKVDDKRFSQGKEILTALLGVLGTIVGFYFGVSQDQVSGFAFDPVVVKMEGDNLVSLSTSVRGGKAPYFYEATFKPTTIPVEKGKTEGQITLPIVTKDVKQDTDVSVVIVVTDSAGRTGNVEYNQVARVKKSGNQ